MTKVLITIKGNRSMKMNMEKGAIIINVTIFVNTPFTHKYGFN